MTGDAVPGVPGTLLGTLSTCPWPPASEGVPGAPLGGMGGLGTARFDFASSDSPRSRDRAIGKTMSEPIDAEKPKRRGNPRMQRGAPSLNPHGRPRTGESLAEVTRTRVSPEQLVERLVKLADGAQSEQVRLAATLALGERGYGKVANVLDATLKNGSTASDTAWIANMPLEERRAELERRRALREQYSTERSDVGGADQEPPSDQPTDKQALGSDEKPELVTE